MADPPGVRQEFMLFTSAAAVSSAAVGSWSPTQIRLAVVEVVGFGREEKRGDYCDCRVEENA